MSSCIACRHQSVPQPKPVSQLLQIRRGYRTRWNGLSFSVENGSGEWTLRVQDSGGNRTLYLAHRGGAKAAQEAAAEFGIFRVLGPGSPVRPDRLAQELNWQEYW